MKMTFKRGFVSGMVTVMLVFGLYLCFFNHPPASETLEANAHLHNSEKLGPPKFGDFGPPKSPQAEASSRLVQLETDGTTGQRTNDKTLRDQGTDHSDVASKSPSLVNGLRDNATQKTALAVDDLTQKDSADRDNDGDTPLAKPDQHPNPKSADDDEGADDNEIGAKTEAKVAGETKERNLVKSPADHDGGATFAQRSIPKIDWDKWVKDNRLVDVGTIWGYCDEPEPPVIGKILLMKDEDRGGLKVAVVMNTTFEEPVESGFIFASVMYGEMSFYEKSLDICTLYGDDEPEPGVEKDTFFNCPMAAGGKYYMKELHIPFYVPSGHFTAKAKLTDQNERTVLCSSADMTL